MSEWSTEWWTEWWTYALADLLMFSARTYWRLLELYNVAVWPLHMAALAWALAIGWCALRGQGRSAAVLLGLAWLWVAWAYHAQRYATLSTAAPWFAAAFALQGMLLVGAGRLTIQPGRAGLAGIGAVGTVLVAWPLLGPLSGRPWTQAEVFGIAPDPTAALTLVLLAFAPRGHGLLWPVPLLWCAVSGATLWTLHAPAAWLLPGLAVLALLVRWRG